MARINVIQYLYINTTPTVISDQLSHRKRLYIISKRCDDRYNSCDVVEDVLYNIQLFLPGKKVFLYKNSPSHSTAQTSYSILAARVCE